MPISTAIPEIPFFEVEKESSTTLTASETENFILRTVIDQQHVSDIAGPSSGFRGKLALLATPKRRKRIYPGDWTSDDFSSPKKKNVFKNMKRTICCQRKKVKSLSSQVRRLTGKISSMESLISLLKSKALISESSENAVKSSVQGVEKIFLKEC